MFLKTSLRVSLLFTVTLSLASCDSAKSTEIESYVVGSKAIRDDIGKIKKISSSGLVSTIEYYKELGPLSNERWETYKVYGSRGSGTLDVKFYKKSLIDKLVPFSPMPPHMGGGPPDEDTIQEARWTSTGSGRIGLNNHGYKDDSILFWEKSRTRKENLIRLISSNDCQKVLELIDLNEKEADEEQVISFQSYGVCSTGEKNIYITEIRANCFKNLGMREEAAVEYAKIAYENNAYLSKKIESNVFCIDKKISDKEALELAISLDPNSPDSEGWKEDLKNLELQKSYYDNQCDDQKRAELVAYMKARKIEFRDPGPYPSNCDCQTKRCSWK